VIPECTINVDTLDLFFRRLDNDSIQSKHVAIRIFLCNELVLLIEIGTPDRPTRSE
jgi:hypothetical protein